VDDPDPEEGGVDIQALIALSDRGQDGDLQALAADVNLQALAAKSFRKGMEYGNRNNRTPDERLMLPQPTFSSLSKEGKSKWIGMPDNDRAVIVSAIGSAVASKPDSSKHPSPGNREHFSANRHNVSFDDQNPYDALRDESGEANNDTPNISMNNLTINHAKYTPSSHKDNEDESDEDERALSLMNVVTSAQVKSKDLKNLPSSNILRALSTSSSVTSPLSGTSQETQWKYGEGDDASNTPRNGKTKNFIKKLVNRKGANNIQLNMTRISFSDADQSPNPIHFTEQLLDNGATENRGVWTDLNAEDKSAIVGAIARRNNGYPGQLGWENDHGLSGRGLMFLGTSEQCGALENDEDGEPEIKNGIFAGVVTLDNGERMLGIFNDYSNTHMSSDPVHSMEQLLNSGATISNGDPSLGDEPHVKLEDDKVIPLVEVDGRLQLICDQPTLSDLTYLKKVEITRASDGYGIKDGDSIPELEDPSADASDEEITRPSVDLVPPNSQGPLERARYIAVTTDPITQYTKIDLDWTIKKSAQGSTAKARVVASPGKIKINKINHLNLSQVMARDTECGEKLNIQGTDTAGMYNYCNRQEDDMHYHMKGATKDTDAHVSM